jgi:putative pyrroloquinoline-quinone binding quinoprotein
MKLLWTIPGNIGRIVHGESTIGPIGSRNGSLPRPNVSLIAGLRSRGPRHIAGLVVALLLSSPGVGLAQTVDTTLWVTNAPVNAIVVDGSTIYIGGNFTLVGPVTGGGGAIDASTGAAHQPYPKVAGTVRTVAPDGSGGWYLGGAFTAVRGQPRNNLARLDAGGNLTAWDPNANGEVAVLAVSGGTVYAGGGFTSIGGRPRNHIAALDAASGASTAWNPNADDSVKALAVGGGTVYAGGNFGNIGRQPRNYIAALDVATGAATEWDPYADNTVSALVLNGGTVYAGGRFMSIGGIPRSKIAAIDATTGIVTSWSPSANSTVHALAVSGGTVYAGGNFISVGGQTRNYIAALDAASGAATPWNPNATGGTCIAHCQFLITGVQALALGEGTVYAGGYFTGIGGQSRGQIAALDPITGVATAWNPIVWSHWGWSFVNCLAVSGSTVYVGGEFEDIGAQPRNGVGEIDAITGAATAWNPNPSWLYQPSVGELVVNGGTVYASGNFSSIGGQARDQVAALDAGTGAATAWTPTPNGSVGAIALGGGMAYLGGSFTSILGQLRNRIAAVDPASGAPVGWDPNADGSVGALAISGGTVYAGGNFTSIGGQTRYHIAALDAATGAAIAWDPNANGSVYALAVSGGRVYAGGNFTSIGGQPNSGIAAITEVGDVVSVGGDPSISEGSLTVVPNPAWAGMQVQYSVVRSGRVRLELLDVTGRVEATLANRIQEPGRHVATWDGVGRRGRLSPGLHFLRLVAPDGVMVRKLAIIR